MLIQVIGRNSNFKGWKVQEATPIKIAPGLKMISSNNVGGTRGNVNAETQNKRNRDQG